jgi:PAS domain S-box-containing protein
MDLQDRPLIDPFVAAQRTIIERIAVGRPLRETLESIVLLIEQQSSDMMCSILLIDEEQRVRHGAAPSLPAAYVRAIDGVKIGPLAGSCGTAAYLRKAVFVDDIATHPAWADYRPVALEHGLRACWSTPIMTPEHQVIGTFAMYYRDVRQATQREIEWIAVATHLAYVAIVSDRARAAEAERQRMLAQVQSGETLRAVILDSVDDAIFYLKVERPDEYRFLWINRAFTKLFGLSETEISGRLMHEVLPPELLAPMLERYARASRTAQRERWEFVMSAPTGEKCGEITIVAIFNKQGQCSNFVCTVHDMTDRIAAERERALLTGKLHQAQRIQALGTLAGGIAHDFNNILAAIGGNTRRLLNEIPADWPLRRHLLEIQKAGSRATDLVRQILTFSKGSPPSYEVFDPRAVTTEALDLLRATIPTNITIRERFSAEAPNIKADSTQFHQILVNLVMNAAHAYDDAGGSIEVSLDRVADEEAKSAAAADVAAGPYLRLCVIDRGCGMDEQTLKRVFEPFFTTRHMGQGTGLGLSVVHGIVEGHGGTIKITSAPAEGTTVSVYLPAASDVSTPRKVEAPAEGSGEHLMYVDDEEALVFLMEIVLSRMGYRISGFTDPMQALEEFKRDPTCFDAVVTDVAMPGMTGPKLASKLREVRQDVPIILTSGYIRDEDREAANRLGIDHLVYKSDTVEQLADAIAKELSSLGQAKGTVPA